MSIARPAATEPVPLRKALVDYWLAVSDERDRYLKRILAAWREGWLSGHAAGYAAGYATAEEDMAAAWHEIADPVSRGRDLKAEGWERRIAAATAEERDAAREHWREFFRQAAATREDLRTDSQRAALSLVRNTR
ncbi:MAG TPA: hypothetical protein VIJ82_21885 [Streptosporangiaceae bacterium]|jgi:hypothetical protein